MAGHTPGPWQGCLHLRSDADQTCGCGYRGGIWSQSADVQICEMGAGRNEGDDMIPVSDRATQIADHWLIAAAPDLLDACRAVAASGMRNAAYDACVAVIAHATGVPEDAR